MKFILEVKDTTAEEISSLIYLGKQTDQAIEHDLAGIGHVTVTEVSQVTNGRLTFEQREKLWAMCGAYMVPFNERDYHIDAKTGIAEGWVGGFRHDGKPVKGFPTLERTIYVGVERDGTSHT